MVFLFEPGNGQVVGIIAAEVKSVPYFELINLDVEKANRKNNSNIIKKNKK